MITVRTNTIDQEITVKSENGIVKYLRAAKKPSDNLDVGTHKNITVSDPGLALRVTNNETNISVVESDILTINGDVSAIDTRIDDLEAEEAIEEYSHLQLAAANIWSVPHGMGTRFPNVLVFDTANERWEPDYIDYIDNNNLNIHLGNLSFAGRAELKK